MKIAKKVLSVLLAIAMVLGTFAVAASANGNPETASHQVKFWLTASPITSGAEWTSRTAYTPAVWTDSQTGDMEVVPGQKVMIAVHCTTNYYVGNCNTYVFHDTRLIDGGEMYFNQVGTKATVTRTKNMTYWNESNPYVAFSVDDDRSSTPSSITTARGFMTALNNARDDSGNCYFKKDGGLFTDTSEAAQSEWGYFFFTVAPNYEAEETDILQYPDECVVAFPVQVPEDAQPGDTYKFMMPEENIRRVTNRAGGIFVSECPDGIATGQVLADLAYSYFSDDQYFDLSGTNITLTVKSGESEVDYSALQAKYDEVKDTVVDNYNNTADFVAALADAKTILDEKTADQTTVDNALTALTDGYAKLTIKAADYTKLTNAKTAANNIVADNYEQDANWTAFQTAKSAAEAIASGLDITHQSEINNAADALLSAISNLTPKTVEEDANYAELDAEIELSDSIVNNQSASWYTTATWSAFTTALANAKAVARDLKAKDQAIIDNAKSALTSARTGLIEADADYTNLNALITECDALNEADYAAAEWVTFAQALADAKAVAKDLKAKDQATVDAAYTALLNAKNALRTLGAADYSALIAEIANVPQYTEDYYTATTWSAYQTVLAAAQKMVEDNNLKESEQIQVNNMVTNLRNAKLDLIIVDADYTAVETALAKIPATSDLTNYYTTASVNTLIAARDAVVRGLKKNDQARVDGFAADIEAAVAALELIPADTTALKSAIDAAKAINSELYTADSYATMKDALDTAEAIYAETGLTKKDDQARIDAAKDALNTARGNLVPAGADYSALTAAIERYESLTASHWTIATWSVATARYNEAVTASKTVYTKEQQSVVDGYAKALNDALDALVEADASFTELNTAVTNLKTTLTTFAPYLTEDYIARGNALVAEAEAADFLALKAKDQAIVDAKTAELVALNNNKEYRPYDYSAINNAKAAYEAIDRSLYTAESLAAVDELFANINWNYTMCPVAGEGQTLSDFAAGKLQENKVLKWADLLVEAEVPEDADYTALDEAIKTAEALLAAGTDNYTEDSVAVLEDALAAGKAVARDLTADDQDIIDKAAADINGAMPLTEKAADYTALDAAIALAKTKNADDYTAASYQAMAEKLAEAEAVARDLKISSQSIIDRAANMLNAAISALVIKPIDVKGNITDVTWTPSENAYNTYTVTVKYSNGTYAGKIQFVDPYGNTRTYTRRSPNVTVTTYKADGTQCHELDREAAYEIWNVESKMTTGMEISAIAKYDYTWESLENAFKFTVNLLPPVEPDRDYTVYSVAASATSGKKCRVDLTIETGADIQGVRTVMSSGNTLTYKNYTVNEAGHKVFNAQASAYLDGENVYMVQIKYGNEWHDYQSYTYTAE